MAITSRVQLTVMTCGSCGCDFAIPETMRAEKQRSGGRWYCPNGHSRVYSESDAAKYKRLYESQFAATAKERENFFAEQRRHEETQKKLRRVEKRVAAGVCPCCKRTFRQLSRHMQLKHSEFVKEHGVPSVKEVRTVA